MAVLNEPQAKGLASPYPARLFYSGAAALLLLLMFLGFQQFYLYGKAYPGRELAPPIRTLLIVHGLGMTAWGLLFLVQPLLIVTANRRLHRRLGQIGAVLAAGLVLLGWKLTIAATLIAPPDLRIWGLAPKQFMAVPFSSLLLFAVFVSIGVWQRRRPEVHRPMMLLASLAVMSAAVSRIGAISGLYVGTVWETLFGPFFGVLLVGGLFLAVRWLLTRSLDRWFAIGYAILAFSFVLAIWVAATEPWEYLMSWLLQ
jgi:hypothetical protein